MHQKAKCSVVLLVLNQLTQVTDGAIFQIYAVQSWTAHRNNYFSKTFHLQTFHWRLHSFFSSFILFFLSTFLSFLVSSSLLFFFSSHLIFPLLFFFLSTFLLSIFLLSFYLISKIILPLSQIFLHIETQNRLSNRTTTHIRIRTHKNTRTHTHKHTNGHTALINGVLEISITTLQYTVEIKKD